MNIKARNKISTKKSSPHFITAWRSPVKQGSGQLHSHPCVEIVFHPSGYGTTITEKGEEYEFAAGSCVIYPPGLGHLQINKVVGEDLCILVNNLISLDMHINKTLYIPQINSSRLLCDMTFLTAPHPGMDKMQQTEFDLRAMALLAALLEQARQHHTPPQEGSIFYVTKAQQYILKNFQTIKRVSEVARKIGVSNDYLRHLFRSHYGYGMREFLIKTRLKRACELLAQSTLTLKEVADACGLPDERYLCTQFRKRMGMTPGDYRQDARKII